MVYFKFSKGWWKPHHPCFLRLGIGFNGGLLINPAFSTSSGFWVCNTDKKRSARRVFSFLFGRFFRDLPHLQVAHPNINS